MADHIELGKTGESHACRFLTQAGYKILETNWRIGRAEVDIIAMDKRTLIFVEVKTRSFHPKVEPTLAISPRKRALLKDAASQYMQLIDHDWAIRFDVVSVIMYNDGGYRIQHHQDSFSPWEE